MSILLDNGSRNGLFAMPEGSSTVFTSAAIDLDGATRIKIELAWDGIDIGSSHGGQMEIWDNGVLLGVLQEFSANLGQNQRYTVYGAAFITPAAGTHTFEIVANVSHNDMALSERCWYRITLTTVPSEVAYVERTTDFTGTNPLISTGSIGFSGTERVRLEAFAPGITYDGSTIAEVKLFEDGSPLWTMGRYETNTFLTGEIPLYVSRFFYPSAGSHVYEIEVTTTSNVMADSAIYFPCWLRITDAPALG